MIHHDASTRKTNTQRNSNRMEPLRSLQASTQLPDPSNDFDNRRISSNRLPLCLHLEELAAMRRSMALRKVLRSTVQLGLHQRNRCSIRPTCSRIQMFRDSRKVRNTSNMAARVRCMVWDSRLSKRHSRHTIKFHGIPSDLAPRLRHWRPNLEFRRPNTTLQASQFPQVRQRPNWRRRTYRRNISSLHTLQLAPRPRRHTAVP